MENALEHYSLKSIVITRNAREEMLHFIAADLVVDTTFLAKSWFIDVSYLENLALMEEITKSSNIKVTMTAQTLEGQILSGEGYLHPNLLGSSAAIKGDGPLAGYEALPRPNSRQ